MNPNQPYSSLLDIVALGGWALVPLLILSVVVLYILVERLLTYRAAKGDVSFLVGRTGEYLRAGDVDLALGFCGSHDSSPARVICHGLERLGRPLPEIIEGMRGAARVEAYGLRRKIDVLKGIAALAPLIGMAGALLGLMYRLGSLLPQEQVQLTVPEVWGAMFTVLAGIKIGVLSLLVALLLKSRASRLINDLDLTVAGFGDVLQEPAPGPERFGAPAY